MEKLRLKIILASVREGRFGKYPTELIERLAKEHGEYIVEVLDLREHELPLFAEAVSPKQIKNSNYISPDVQMWADHIREADAFIFVTPEYNHGYPASLKNNIDYLYHEWAKKPAAFISYGATGGSRSISQLYGVCIELSMVPLRTSVHIMNPWNLVHENNALKDGALEKFEKPMNYLLAELVWWGRILKQGRGT